MALELWVHGPRYGESILLIWHEAGASPDEKVCKAALIDCHGHYSPTKKKLKTVPAALRPLQNLQEPWTLAFVAGTHPHLDHVACLAQALAELEPERRVDQTIWWGDDLADAFLSHRIRAKHYLETGGKDRAKAAKATMEFLSKARHLKVRQYKPMEPHSGVMLQYERELPAGEGHIRVWGISPCATERNKFRDVMRSQDPTAAKPTPVHANRASLGFLIQYKDAQILLGGDMEEENWRHFNAVRDDRHECDDDLPPLCPHVIKVSHHGSSTGRIPGMWTPGSGFFGTAPGAAPKPVCIVTPWYDKLPDEKILEEIRCAGCRVVVTGRGEKPPVGGGYPL